MFALRERTHRRDREANDRLSIRAAARAVAQLALRVDGELDGEHVLDQHVSEVARFAVLHDAHAVHLVRPAQRAYVRDDVERIGREHVQIDVAPSADVTRRDGPDEPRREGLERRHRLERHHAHREESARPPVALDLDHALEESRFDLAVARQIARPIAKAPRTPLTEQPLGGEALGGEVLLHLLAVHDLGSELRDRGTQPAVALPAHLAKGASASRSFERAPPTTTPRRGAPWRRFWITC